MEFSDSLDKATHFTKKNIHWKIPLYVWLMAMIAIAVMGNNLLLSPFKVVGQYIMGGNYWLLYAIAITLATIVVVNIMTWNSFMGPGDFLKQDNEHDRKRSVVKAEKAGGPTKIKTLSLISILIEFVLATTLIAMTVAVDRDGHFFITTIIGITAYVMAVMNLFVVYDCSAMIDWQEEQTINVLRS